MKLKNPALYIENKPLTRSFYDTSCPGRGHLVKSAANEIFYTISQILNKSLLQNSEGVGNQQIPYN
jgi:hypothetical protein